MSKNPKSTSFPTNTTRGPPICLYKNFKKCCRIDTFVRYVIKTEWIQRLQKNREFSKKSEKFIFLIQYLGAVLGKYWDILFIHGGCQITLMDEKYYSSLFSTFYYPSKFKKILNFQKCLEKLSFLDHFVGAVQKSFCQICNSKVKAEARLCF